LRVWFEFGKFPNSNLPLFISPYSFFQTLISRARAGFLFPVQPSRPNQQRIPTHQPSIKPATPFLSPTDWSRVSVKHSSSSLLPSPRICTAPGKPHRGRACAGRDTLPVRPARTPRDRSALTRESNPAQTGNTSLPCATHLCILACAKGSGAATAARAVKPGAAWGFRLVVCGARVQKQGRRRRPSRPSSQPHWGFPFPLPLRERREREKEGGAAAVPGRGGTRPHRNTDDVPREERAAAAPRRERKEPGTRSRERGAGSTDRS
jgi:hypothetical protein